MAPSSAILTTSILSLLASLSTAAPVCRNHRAQPSPPPPPTGGITLAIAQDFADPSITQVNKTWYAFATQPHDDIHLQLASSPDFHTWHVWPNHDILPQMPAWVNASHPNFWAPSVTQVGPEAFVLYFSAMPSSDKSARFHCGGTATATRIEGPYAPAPEPWVCPLEHGGAIDLAGFEDRDGARYVLYKVDGNSVGHGGLCDNSFAPVVRTPIMLQRVEGDGVTRVRGTKEVEILANDVEARQALVEAPSLVWDEKSAEYVLFYSSGCYLDSSYSTSWATSPRLTDKFQVKESNVLFKTGMNGLIGPGGLAAAPDGKHAVFHAASGKNDGKRYMYTDIISVSGGRVMG